MTTVDNCIRCHSPVLGPFEQHKNLGVCIRNGGNFHLSRSRQRAMSVYIAGMLNNLSHRPIFVKQELAINWSG